MNNYLSAAISRFKKITITGLALLSMAMLILMPQSAADGVRSALDVCQSLVIPALFPMMFIAAFIMDSGVAVWLGRLFSLPSRLLFGLPGEAGIAVLMAMIGGYPTGASVISSLCERKIITSKQASRMILFCVAPSPVFVVGAIGIHLLGSVRVGFVTLAAQLISVILVGFITRFLPGGKNEPPSDNHNPPVVNRQLSNAVISAARKAASSIIMVCAFVIIFGAAVSILQGSGILAKIEDLLTSIGVQQQVAGSIIPIMLEVTGNCGTSVIAPNIQTGILLLAFGIGFGGFAVHFQIFSILRDLPVSRPLFFAARLLQGILACLLTCVMLPLMNLDAVIDTISVSASVSGSYLPTLHAMPTASGSVFLIVMCMMLIFTSDSFNRDFA